MGNLWPYKNHHYRSKYLIVLLQEHCEKIQFKSGHPVLLTLRWDTGDEKISIVTFGT